MNQDIYMKFFNAIKFDLIGWQVISKKSNIHTWTNANKDFLQLSIIETPHALYDHTYDLDKDYKTSEFPSEMANAYNSEIVDYEITKINKLGAPIIILKQPQKDYSYKFISIFTIPIRQMSYQFVIRSGDSLKRAQDYIQTILKTIEISSDLIKALEVSPKASEAPDQIHKNKTQDAIFSFFMVGLIIYSAIYFTKLSEWAILGGVFYFLGALFNQMKGRVRFLMALLAALLGAGLFCLIGMGIGWLKHYL